MMDNNDSATPSPLETERVDKSAAVDVTTAWGVDSFFALDLDDPWADECVANLIDVCINHKTVYLPLPSKRALEHLVWEDMPDSVRLSHERELLRLKENKFAEEVALPVDILATEYRRFHDFCIERPAEIRNWVAFQRRTPRIVGQNTKHVPSRAVNAYWPQRPRDELEQKVGITEEYLSYAFDVYARTIQYQTLAGDAWYFRHPFRRTAIGGVEHTVTLPCTSWGRCLRDGMRDGSIKRSLPGLLDIVASIRAASGDMTWYSLAKESPARQAEAMHDIAASAGLPGKLKEPVLRRLRITLLTTGTVVGAAASPVVALVLGVGAILVSEWKGNLPAVGARTKILQGRIERPYLPRLSEKGKNAVS